MGRRGGMRQHIGCSRAGLLRATQTLLPTHFLARSKEAGCVMSKTTMAAAAPR